TTAQSDCLIMATSLNFEAVVRSQFVKAMISSRQAGCVAINGRYLLLIAAAPASAHWWSCSPVPPPQPTAPITLPPETTGTPPMLGSASPPRTVATLPQKAGDDSLSCAMSLVGRLNAAAATALPREVAGVKNPSPSPRPAKRTPPASPTAVAAFGVPGPLPLACAALTAFPATSSVSSAMSLSAPFQVYALLRSVL